ncbi:MAG: hypothetical protein ACYTX0_49485, partial [Nostoc sp.]
MALKILPHLLSQVMPMFENYKICVLGDREFCSVKLAKQTWMIREKAIAKKLIRYCRLTHNIAATGTIILPQRRL